MPDNTNRSKESRSRRIDRPGCRVHSVNNSDKKEKPSFWKRSEHFLFASCTGLFLILHIASGYLLHSTPRLTSSLGIGAILVGGFPIVKHIYKSLRHFKINVDVLVAIAVVAATSIGHYLEAGTVLFIHLFGEMLEIITVSRVKRSIQVLLNLIPETVRIKCEDGEEEIPVSKVKPGDILIIKPGERIGTDGVVVKGHASVDQAPITGESMPVEKTIGDMVYSGTLNKMSMKVPDPENFSIQRGQGVIVSYEDFQIILGSREHMSSNVIPISPKVERYMAERETKGETVLLIAHHDGQQAEVCGAVSIADTIREEAFPAVNELKGMNVQTVMHTGDNLRTAQAIARSAGIDHIQAELLPEEKVAALEAYKKQSCKVAYDYHY